MNKYDIFCIINLIIGVVCAYIACHTQYFSVWSGACIAFLVKAFCYEIVSTILEAKEDGWKRW